MINFLASRPSRLFDKYNPHWNNRNHEQNVLFLHFAKVKANDILRSRGYISLNEVLDLLGFERSIRAGQQGWLRDPDPGEGDGYIEFGIWANGYTRGKEWLNGDLDAVRLHFNIDRTTISMPRRIKKQKAEGKL